MSDCRKIFAFVLLLFGANVQFSPPAIAQAYKDAVGYNALVAEKLALGETPKNGSGLKVLQAEADTTVYERNPDGSFVFVLDGEGNPTTDRIPIGIKYMPNPQTPPESQFSGKTFIDGTGTNFVDTTGNNIVDESSGHASGVGRIFYGSTSSMSGGITDITGYQTDDYIDRVLGVGSINLTNTNGTDPITPGPNQAIGLKHGFDVANHSYVGNFEPIKDPIGNTVLTSAEVLENAAQRFDYVINRDNTVAVVGANNGSASSTPQIWAHSYNAITVGLSNGNHSTGLTSNYGAGRYKPDIVAPNNQPGPTGGLTSISTPMVASTAAVLRELANAGNLNGAHNEVIKSVIFAGATKEEFGSAWDRTETRPIDEVYGVGELNILNSYHIMEGGEFHVSSPGSSVTIGEMGWDFSNVAGSEFHDYTFDILNGVTKFSAALVWNAQIIDSNRSPSVFDASVSLANLDLELLDSTGTLILQQSSSTDYNLEHIWKTDLGVGSYKLRVSGASGSTAADYGLAWRFNAVPEPSSAMMLGVTTLWFLTKRRRSR